LVFTRQRSDSPFSAHEHVAFVVDLNIDFGNQNADVSHDVFYPLYEHIKHLS